MVSSEEKPQNFPLYSIHIDMDSFILFNDDIYPSIVDKPLVLEQQAHINQETISHTQRNVTTTNTTSLQEEPSQMEHSNLPDPKITETLNTNPKQEITWYL